MHWTMVVAALIASSAPSALAQGRPVGCMSSVTGAAGEVLAITDVSPRSKEIVSSTIVMWRPPSIPGVENGAYPTLDLLLIYEPAADGELSDPTRARVVSTRIANAPGPRPSEIRYTTEGHSPIVTPAVTRFDASRLALETQVADFIRTAKPKFLTIAYIGPASEVLVSAAFDLTPTAARDAQALEAIAKNKPLVEEFQARSPKIDPYLCDRSRK